MLSSIPAIQPLSNKDLSRMASGFGYRIDPFTKSRRMHGGMDFSAPRGTPIYAASDGKIIRADSRSSGYGKHIRIDHGFGYVTLYAHLNKYNVKRNQIVKKFNFYAGVCASTTLFKIHAIANAAKPPIYQRFLFSCCKARNISLVQRHIQQSGHIT